MICSAFNCNEVQALEKDDTYLTMLLCKNIEKNIFEQRFNEIMEKKRKK